MSSRTRVVITGGAGFIGMHLALELRSRGHEVIAIDNLDPTNDLELKRARRRELERARIPLLEFDILDREAISTSIREGDAVVHLAAQAGIRRHLDEPSKFLEANVTGTERVLDASRRNGARHVILASSSSVYEQTSGPASETSPSDRPTSAYAASKKSAEVLSHSYSHMFALPVTVVRLFSVYGSFGRGDMAPLMFARAIRQRETLTLHDPERLARDFTHVRDVTTAIASLIERPASPWRVVNVGRGEPRTVAELVSALENRLGLEAKTIVREKDRVEVDRTWADTTELERLTGFKPRFDLEAGIDELGRWLEVHEPLFNEVSP